VFSVRATAATPAVLEGISGGLLESNLIRPEERESLRRYDDYGTGWTVRVSNPGRGKSCFGIFAKLLKATIAMSVRMEQLGSHWTDFHEIWYLSIFSKMYRGISNFIKIGQE
jgi:hypothetical protein